MVSADYFGEFSRAITARLNGGDGFEIMFDRTAVRPGWVWDYDTALEVARGMERYNARWLEEPFD